LWSIREKLGFKKKRSEDSLASLFSIPQPPGRFVVYVDDHEVLARLICEMLEMQGYQPVQIHNPVNALKHFQEMQVTIVLNDDRTTQTRVDDFAKELFRAAPHIPLILITGYGVPSIQSPNTIQIEKQDLFEFVQALTESGIDGYVAKQTKIKQPVQNGTSGRLEVPASIVTVCTDFMKTLDSVVRNPEDLLALNPRQFEELVAGIWQKFGYEVELTARTRDQGRDVIAIRRTEASLRFLIECKRYSPENKVGIGIVRSLYGVVRDENATKGILATTSTFTRDAKQFIDRHIWELEGSDFESIIQWVRKLRG